MPRQAMPFEVAGEMARDEWSKARNQLPIASLGYRNDLPSNPKTMFDFDATLPLMAVQFLLLVALLNAVFYKPLTKAIEDRSDYIRTNETEARERLAKAEHLAAQYEQELAASRKQYQQTIATAQQEAQTLADQQIAAAQQEAQQQREQVQRELDQQKQAAMQSLEQQVESLSHQILDKLLVRS